MLLYHRKPNDPAPLSQPDPYIFKDNDQYFIYTTGGEGAHLYTSKRLKEGWKYHGVCLEMPGQMNCWAPAVIKIDDIYYMYYSSILTTDPDEHSQRLRLAVSDTPEGPFIYQQDLLEPFSIDPHAVMTPSGLYLFYSINDLESERAGTYIVCDRMVNPTLPEGRPAAVVRPSLSQELYMKDRFKPGQDWYTLEGAFYFYKNGTHYVMYSGANHTDPSYFVGYATAQGPEDADLRDLLWRKQPSDSEFAPVLYTNDAIEGMGHNSVIFDQGKYWIVYHGRKVGDLEKYREDSRMVRIDELKVEGDLLEAEVTE